MRPLLIGIAIVLMLGGCEKTHYELVIHNATIYDGSGQTPINGSVAVNADTIAAVGDIGRWSANQKIDAQGMAVSPGFINMLSWANESLFKDGRSMSDIKQGVTLEVFGEGWSAGPRKKKSSTDSLWTTLGEFFDRLERSGVSTNFASFVGATTVRMHEVGQENRKPTEEEMSRMRELVHQAMRDGAMGIGSSLIYTPAAYATTDELIELCNVASSYGGMYITHLRSEGKEILPALNEAFLISYAAKIRTEIYHLKINQSWNWNKIDTVLNRIDSARTSGLDITANMYPYIASASILTTRLPLWVQEGGAKAMRKRLTNRVIRKKVLTEMENGIPSKNSDPTNVKVLGFSNDVLDSLYKGKYLSEIAAHMGKSADEAVIDLLIKERAPIPAIFFLISPDNLKKMLAQPYVSIGSDAPSVSIDSAMKETGAHPRMYGTFARILSQYVREEKLITTEEAIRRMTSLPAENLRLSKRGIIKSGYFADLVIFDPNETRDHATFDDPHQYATGVHHVFVNGVQVIKDGEHTGNFPGRCIRGPGYQK